MTQPGRNNAPQYRSGIGYDVHVLVEGRRLVLGGETIPYERGLKGHSDADVLVHALMDALLGAAGLGDIGELFPDTDNKYKDVSSIGLLQHVRERVETGGFKVANVDCVLLAEEPKIMPYKPAMKKNIAAALGIDAGRVNIKATTNEGLGTIGRGEGMAAFATALLRSVEAGSQG